MTVWTSRIELGLSRCYRSVARSLYAFDGGCTTPGALKLLTAEGVGFLVKLGAYSGISANNVQLPGFSIRNIAHYF
ncbi:hypothetical protein [Laspinema olomoucense]|uniref:hypothetical protein n=1 Tax=Laspinema olomoucense TaxID=3231600 RepID=UPI0021BB0F9A|nr:MULTISPECIES: hypothetical protein [unclassified Laspinema]MCT7972632.1 hypothetical protein [Laspinema sp. D3d]MCT7995356.1 hypothetical protein [Laspinema sp. D3c]